MNHGLFHNYWLIAVSTAIIPPALASSVNLPGPDLASSWEKAGIAAISLAFGVVMFIRGERRDARRDAESMRQRKIEEAAKAHRSDRYEQEAKLAAEERQLLIKELTSVKTQCATCQFRLSYLNAQARKEAQQKEES